MTDDLEGYDLVVPFLAVTSVGGPYEDRAFVAGFRCGAIDSKLEPRTIAASSEMIEDVLEAQVDLLAMRHGYRFDVLARLADGWLHVGFTRVDE